MSMVIYVGLDVHLNSIAAVWGARVPCCLRPQLAGSASEVF